LWGYDSAAVPQRTTPVLPHDTTMGAALDRWRSWNAAKLPGRAVNRWVRGWRSDRLAIEVHRTACIVTHPPGGEKVPNAALVNPANERLEGTNFSPEECWSNLYGDPVQGRWDKEFATYPFQAIDGLVTEFGGDELKQALRAQPADTEGVRCPHGSALVTRSIGELSELFDAVVHVAAPFYQPPRAEGYRELMTAAYHAAFRAALCEGLHSLAVPLLGAGARGVDLPRAEALAICARAAVSWEGAAASGGSSPSPPENPAEPGMTLRFGVQDSTTAHALADAIEGAIEESAIVFESIAGPPRGSERWAL